jgi:hypothetical protein
MLRIEPNCLPRTAERVDNHLVFYDDGWAIGRCDLHDDQEIYGSDSPIQHVPGTVEVWPDDWEGENAFFRLKPETFRAYETGVIPDRGPEQIYFDKDQSREWLFDELPALRDAVERRSYLAAFARWEKECDRIYDTKPDIDNDELPPQPVFEPARAEWDAWRAALTEWEMLMNALDVELGERRREGRPAFNDNQKARVDALGGQIQKLGNAYMDKLPMDKIEPKAVDSKKQQPAENALTSSTAYAIACMAARHIDDFNDGWASTERWPDAPLLPAKAEENYPAIFHQLNSAIRRIITMSQRPRGFRAERVAHILGILKMVHEETYNAVVEVIANNGCVLPEPVVAGAAHRFIEQVMWQVQHRHLKGYYTGKGDKPDPTSFDNIRVFLALRGVELRFDEFTNSIEWCEGHGYEWQWKKCTEDNRTALWLDTHTIYHGLTCAKDFFRDSVARIAREASYDSLRDTVDRLEWDGVERLGSWLSHAVGCPDDSYHRAVGANIIGGLVKRSREPGAKHDETVLFISEEGTAKSSMCKALALRPEWFIDSVELGGRPQDIIPQLKGKQIIELAELSGMSRTETTKLKAFMSRENDNATLKYKEEATDHLRRHIFIGTTNEDTPLLSQTGNRRWLPVHVVGKINLDWIRENREQLYAEAAEWHAEGEDFRIPESLWAVAGQHQEAARERTGAEDVLGFAFEGVTDCYVTSADVQLFASERRLPLKDVRTALKRMGFKRVAHRDGDDVSKVWRRGGPAAVRFKATTYINQPCMLVKDWVEAVTAATPPCPVGMPPLPQPRGIS